MAVVDLYSKRRKRKLGEVPDVYSYDVIPSELKIQLIHIFEDSLFDPKKNRREDVYNVWTRIVSTLNREYGSFTLAGFRHEKYSTYYDEFHNFLFCERSTDRIIDGLELAFCEMNTTAKEEYYAGYYNRKSYIDELIEEANQRFKEHGVGYRFAENIVIRIDSEYIHSEITKPVLTLLQGDWCAGAEEEFYSAHEHYRQGNYKEALNDCLKSFESILKSVCEKHDWEITGKGTASNLIDICFENGLIPKFWSQHFNSLRSSLEAGVPTGRNKISAHGQGREATAVPHHIAAYMINTTATCLRFVCEAEAELQRNPRPLD